MNPQALPSLLANSMGQQVPEPSQVTQSSPNFMPNTGAQPSVPLPNRSPESMMHLSALHKAFARRGMQVPRQVGEQLMQPGSAAPMGMQPNAAQQGMMMPKSEAELIIHALQDRLKLIGKHESAVRDHMFPSHENKSSEGEKKNLSLEDMRDVSHHEPLGFYRWLENTQHMNGTQLTPQKLQEETRLFEEKK